MAAVVLVLVLASCPRLCWAAAGDQDDAKGKGGAAGDAVEVTILRDQQPVTQSNNLVWVGERINLSVSVPNGYTVSLYNWTIPTVYVKDWPATKDQASVTPLPAADKLKSSLDFCWVDGGTVSQPAAKTVECAVHIEGQGGVHRKAEFRVRRPTVTTFSVDVSNSLARLTPFQEPFTRMELCGPQEEGGARFAAELGKVDGSYVGRWQLVQLVKPSRTWDRATLMPGMYHWVSHPQNGRMDIGDDYPLLERQSAGYWEKSDSPAHGLTNNREVKVNHEQYWLYLMFMPPGSNSIWVPLEYQSWEWSGEAKEVAGAWTMTSQPAPAVVTNRTPTTNFPTWTEDFNKNP